MNTLNMGVCGLTKPYKFRINVGTEQRLRQRCLPLTNVRKHVANDQIPQHVLTYKFALRPTRRQHQRLAEILEDQRQLYNAALESRIDFYRKTGKTLSHFDMCGQLTELRKDAEYSGIPLNLQRATLKRLDLAFQGFFRRLKKGQTPGFPRFKGKGWWNSFGFSEFQGIRFDGKRLRIKGVTGSLRVSMHRQLPESKILSCQFRRDAKGWQVCLQVRVPSEALPETGKIIGLDMGLSSLAVLSTGEAIPNLRTTKRHARELRLRQRHMSRCKKGSNGRKKAREAVARVHTKIRNTRATYLHQVSAKLVRENDVIAIEKLNVQGMAAGMLAKSVNDAAWSQLKEYLLYKAVKAGRQIVEVKAAGTSQTCPECGQVAKKTLSQRIHNCDCGCVLDRDHAAALVILQRAVVGSVSSERKAVAYA